MDEPVLYRDEIWTGIEYQVAAHLFTEGMIREGLSIIRGVHDRYDGSRHNPWNEVECGDHYARALASWGCLIELCGFKYDGPAGRLGFAPRWQADDFRAFFSAAQGWGTLSQKRDGTSQRNEVAVTHGKLTLRELVLEAPEGASVTQVAASRASQPLDVQWKQQGAQVSIRTSQPATIDAGQTLHVQLSWKKG
jgi:familyl 116 glycosyl hydrolase-like protein